MIPVVIAILGNFFWDMLKEFSELGIDFKYPISIVTNYITVNSVKWIEYVILILAALGAICLFVLLVLAFLGVPFFYYMCETMREAVSAEYKREFYDNYIRVVKSIMENKKDDYIKYEVYLSGKN